MIFIRRAVDKHKAYTVIMLPGEPTKWIPTTDYEHQRILEIFKQDKYYEGIENDFTEYEEIFNKKKAFLGQKKMILQEYRKIRDKMNRDFLNSALDKEKKRPTIIK